jgi:hypothetical protein
MRNLDLVDAVMKLHDIARLVEAEVGQGNLSEDIRNVADRLHALSVEQNRASYVTDEIIKQVKQ